MSDTVEEQIQHAFLLANSGQMQEAQEQLLALLKSEPQNARAWYLLSQVVTNRQEKIECLKTVLKLTHNNEKIESKLRFLLTNSHVGLQPLRGHVSEKVKFSQFFVIITAICVLVLLFSIGVFSLFALRNQKTSSISLNSSFSDSVFFITSPQEFENSVFCHKYDCYLALVLPSSLGTDYLYQVKQYPKWNDFLIEIVVNDGVISDFGLSLDPAPGYEERKLINQFLKSIRNEKEPPQFIIEFVNSNLDRRVFQICESNSTVFDSKTMWVGKIGGTPTISVSTECLQ